MTQSVFENSTTLTGQVVKTPRMSTSPAGIEHVQFSIDHQSIQNEAGMNRQAFVRIKIVASGDVSQHLMRDLIEGSNVKVSGFLNRHQSKNGQPFLALHAQYIEMI